MPKQLECILIDDQKKDRENLRILLNMYCSGINIIGEANDRKSILKLLGETKPNLVFMDIELGSSTIFDIIQEIDNPTFKIVFVSAHDKYAIHGYKYDAIDYLLKPIDPKELIAVVNKAQHLIDSFNSKQEMIESFGKSFRSMFEKAKISISDSKGVHLLEVNTILFCKGEGSYTTIAMHGGSELVVSKNLKSLQDMLEEHQFFRVHKSYLINLNHVDFVMKEHSGAVILQNGISIPVSRKTKKELLYRLSSL